MRLMSDPLNFVDTTGRDAWEWVEEQTGLAQDELLGLAIDSAVGVAACSLGGMVGCGVVFGGLTVVGGMYDALDENDEWWVEESSPW